MITMPVSISASDHGAMDGLFPGPVFLCARLPQLQALTMHWHSSGDGAGFVRRQIGGVGSVVWTDDDNDVTGILFPQRWVNKRSRLGGSAGGEFGL